MKTVVLGDIHGRICWWDIIQKENPDRIIFMGDYVSTHDKNISQEQQCSNLEDILNFKRERNDDVILLRGNHDMQHLGYSWAECSGFFPKVYCLKVTKEKSTKSTASWLSTVWSPLRLAARCVSLRASIPTKSSRAFSPSLSRTLHGHTASALPSL